ncbi:hypothetical protein Trco_003958 [Trichoderma cornu-damae]|uniref:Uncharacterized protein n=1 Tax=Trichoderma cornu-damae TaxID=654480 RepID=A0A9P8QLK3_9HYPO|nr:hypothetical protein Trco_003958 [Trichoderma cornu-damae]
MLEGAVFDEVTSYSSVWAFADDVRFQRHEAFWRAVVIVGSRQENVGSLLRQEGHGNRVAPDMEAHEEEKRDDEQRAALEENRRRAPRRIRGLRPMLLVHG